MSYNLCLNFEKFLFEISNEMLAGNLAIIT